MKQSEKFARGIIPAPLREPLVYRVPDALSGKVAPGSRVLVPLKQRIMTGIAIDFIAETFLDQTKSIIDSLDEQPIVDPHLLKLAQWIAQYYLASLGEVLATMLPPN